MTRAAAFLLALLASLPAAADMYQDARNATLPQAFTLRWTQAGALPTAKQYIVDYRCSG